MSALAPYKQILVAFDARKFTLLKCLTATVEVFIVSLVYIVLNLSYSLSFFINLRNVRVIRSFVLVKTVSYCSLVTEKIF